MSDNFHFDIAGAPLEKALDIAFTHHRSAVGWAEIAADPDERSHEAVWGASRGRKRLVLFWTESPKMTPLPGPMDAKAVEVFVRAWLQAADYGLEPNHDGSNGKGWRVYNEGWGHVANDYKEFVAIEPIWEMYGK